jgi:hypothetical protein
LGLVLDESLGARNNVSKTLAAAAAASITHQANTVLQVCGASITFFSLFARSLVSDTLGGMFTPLFLSSFSLSTIDHLPYHLFSDNAHFLFFEKSCYIQNESHRCQFLALLIDLDFN